MRAAQVPRQVEARSRLVAAAASSSTVKHLALVGGAGLLELPRSTPEAPVRVCDGVSSRTSALFDSQYSEYNRAHVSTLEALQSSGLRYTMLCPGFMVDEPSAHKEAAARVFVGTNPTLLDGLGGLVATYDEVATVATRAVLEAPTAWQNALVGVASREGDYWPRFARGVWRYTIQRQ